MTVELFADITTEWRALALLLEPANGDWINRLAPGLFTHERVSVFHAIQDAFIRDGMVTPEGINHFYGSMPGQLFAAQGGNLNAIVPELARLARKRQAHNLSQQLRKVSIEHNPTIEDIQALLTFDPILAEEDSTLKPGASELLTDLIQKQRGLYKYAKSGLNAIDSSLGGEWKPKSAVILAATPGSGKTTLVAQSMLAMANGYTNESTGEHITTPSLFFSFEMAKSDLMVKWLGNALDIDTTRIQNGRIDSTQFNTIEQKSIQLQGLPMYVIDNGALTLGQIIYEIKKHIRDHGVRVVFIDYLQIVNHSPTGNKNSDLGDFTQHMKALAKREDITIVILSQVTEDNSGTFRTRDSGNVGSIVDVMFELSLDDDQALGSGLRNVTLRRVKNRFGATGTIPLIFNGPYQRFEEGTLTA